MSFKILYVTATKTEAEALKRIEGLDFASGSYNTENATIYLLITGVGSVSTAWSMMKWISKYGKPDLAVNGGIAGTFNDDILIGDVVMPASDCFADSGIEDGDTFRTLYEASLQERSESPFISGSISADIGYLTKMQTLLRPVNAITVNTATGSESTRLKLVNKFNPDIETMEGATFFYICTRENIPFLALRAISNRIEHRNRKKWKIQSALQNLSEKLSEVIIRLEQ